MSIAAELVMIFLGIFTAVIMIGLIAQISDYLRRIAIALERMSKWG